MYIGFAGSVSVGGGIFSGGCPVFPIASERLHLISIIVILLREDRYTWDRARMRRRGNS